MFSIVFTDTGAVLSFDTSFKIQSDWLTLDSGIFRFADILEVNISNATLTICSNHVFDSQHIGLFGAGPVGQGIVTGSTPEERLESLLTYLVSRGDIALG